MTDQEAEEFDNKADEFYNALFMSQALNYLMHNPSAFEFMKDRPPWNNPEYQDVDWYKLESWEFNETGINLILRT